MITAYMAFAMVMIMMVALDIGIEFQFSFQECCYCCICVAGHATIQLNARLGQCHLCATADTAADQYICIQCAKNPGQRAMTAAVGVNNLRSNNCTVLYFVDLKLFGVAEVLENFSVFVPGLHHRHSDHCSRIFEHRCCTDRSGCCGCDRYRDCRHDQEDQQESGC